MQRMFFKCPASIWNVLELDFLQWFWIHQSYVHANWPMGAPDSNKYIHFFKKFPVYQNDKNSYLKCSNHLGCFLMNFRYGIISLHAKLQLPRIVDVTAVGVINRVGLLLSHYEAWCSAPAHHVGHSAWLLKF